MTRNCELSAIQATASFVAHYSLVATCVVLTLAMPAQAFAMGGGAGCPGWGAPHWPNHTPDTPQNVYYDFDPATLYDSNQINQITNAIAIWNNMFINNNVGIRFVRAPSGTAPNLLLLNDPTTACTPDIAVARTSGSRTLTPLSTRIVFYPLIQCSYLPIDPTKNGYNSIFFKIALHELGHTLGIFDVIADASGVGHIENCQNQIQGFSVENTFTCVPWNANDQFHNEPIAPSTCDVGALNNVYPPGSGGTTGGGCNDSIHTSPASGGAESPQLCNGCNCSPIVIDVDGNGFELTSAADGVVFDILANGQPQQISWISSGSDDAFLVLDRNGNGLIDDGSEVFGDSTPQPPSDQPNGFAALAVFDTPEEGGNGDGVIDASDSIYSRLQLWRDRNHNGISESDELFSLPALGVRAIELDYRPSRRVDEFGNEFRYRAKIHHTRGSHDGRWAFDVFFQGE